MTEDDKNQLLNAILADDDLAKLRGSTLNRGLAAVRRRRRRIAVVRTTLFALPVAVLAFVVLRPARTTHEAALPIKQIAMATPIKHASAEQLLAMFPHRAVALVGQPGQRQLVFLDEVPTRTEPNRPSETEKNGPSESSLE